jgi:hypothetical protein
MKIMKKIKEIKIILFIFFLFFSFFLLFSFSSFLKVHLLACPVKHFFHIDCPGCGMQRSIIALLEGDLWNSLSFYPATIPIFVFLIYTAFHLIINFKHGATIIKWGYIFCSIIIFTFYIYKIITYKIFLL